MNPAAGAEITGTWNAEPATGTSIALNVRPTGDFTWKVTQKGQSQQFAGTSTYGSGILTLARAGGPALVGRVSWRDPTHLTSASSATAPTTGARFLEVIEERASHPRGDAA